MCIKKLSLKYGAKLSQSVYNNNFCFSSGDRVAIEPGVPCRMCSFCKEGRYNLCHDMKGSGVPPIDGSLARFYVHAADFCYK